MARNMRAVAFHEAGHAVVAYAVNLGFNRISIIPYGHVLGRLDHGQWCGTRHPLHENDPRLPGLIRKHIIVKLAGSIAEEIATGIYNSSGASADCREAVDLATRTTSGLERLQSYMDKMHATSDKLVRRHWLAVDALAEELLRERELEAFQALPIIYQAMRRHNQLSSGYSIPSNLPNGV